MSSRIVQYSNTVANFKLIIYIYIYTMVMSRDQNAARRYNVKTDKSPFEWGGRVQIFWNNLNE
jgi:hypothetical protein